MPTWDRDSLYQRINLRVDEMIKLGLYQEWLKNKELYPDSKIIRNTIGYSEFFEFDDIDIAIDKIKQYTRNFAKRQLTYFRSNSEIKLINNENDILEDLNA